MGSYHRDANGNFVAKYTEEKFVNILEKESTPAATTEIAEEVGCSRRRAHERLQELERKGEIYSNLSGNERVWSLGSPIRLEERTLADYAAANLSEIPKTNAKGMVIAIQKPHSRDIISGRKKIEFRRGSIKKINRPDIAFIYEPSPTQSIVGVFEIESVERLPVSELIELGVEETPSTRESLKEYFSGINEGTAIHIGQAKVVDPHVPLNYEQDSTWRYNPPQSFYYVDPEEFISKFPQTKEEKPPVESQQSGSSSRTS